MIQTENFPQVEVSSKQELRQRLQAHHNSSDTVRLVTYKKIVPDKYLSRRDVLDELLCFGWIDGIRRVLDDTRTMQLISPRKVHHRTQTYKDRFIKLEKEWLMTDAGRRYVELSKSLWLRESMEDVDAYLYPIDLREEFDKLTWAKEFFDRCSPSSKRFMLRYIKIAKTDKTRKKRIALVALMASQHKKIPGC
jgi:uncharacterized protein YdeI (YjbR/CyaY-like superfamily)